MPAFSENFVSSAKSIGQGVRELKTLSLSRLRKVFSLMGRREKILLAVLAAVAIGSFSFSVHAFYINHTSPAPSAGGSYTEGLLGQPGYINPLLARQEPDLTLTNLLFAGLYQFDQNGNLVPDLADGMPQISTDQKTYTVNLKHGLTWHNGQGITADDVVFTIQLLQDPDYKSPLRSLWTATTVTKLSDYSVQFTTKDVSGPFIDNLILPILPKNVWQNVDPQDFLLSKNNLEAVGSGPYSIKQIEKLPSGVVEEIILQPFDGYYAGKPKISQLTFKFYNSEDDMLNAFHSREIQGFGFVPLGSSLYLDKQQPNANLFTVPLPQYQEVFFNLRSSILGDQNVRQALAMATDRQEIINGVFNGNAQLPNSPWLPAGQGLGTTTTPNLAAAQSLLSADGWQIDPKTGIRTNSKGNQLAFTITTNDMLVNAQAAQILADQWRKLDIQVNLNIVQAAQLSGAVISPRNFDVLLYPQKFNPDPDPFPFWHSSQINDPGLNLSGFSNSAADGLIVDARTTTDLNQRQQDYTQFNSLITQDVPVIFLDQTEFIYAVDNSVKNINLNVLYDPSMRFNGIDNWYVDEKRVWK